MAVKKILNSGISTGSDEKTLQTVKTSPHQNMIDNKKREDDYARTSAMAYANDVGEYPNRNPTSVTSIPKSDATGTSNQTSGTSDTSSGNANPGIESFKGTPFASAKSETYLAAEKYLNDMLDSGYTSSYSGQIQGLIDKYNGREKFLYDISADPLYQSAKDQSINLGALAMMDTIGQASAMTGGYGNSYATSAGNQAYQRQIQALNDNIPEYYATARNNYDAEGDALLNSIGLMSAQEEQDYARWADRLNTAYNNTNRLYAQDYNEWNAENTQNYNNYWAGANLAETKRQYEKSFAENQRQYDESFAENQRQYDESMDMQQQQYSDALALKAIEAAQSSGDPYWSDEQTQAALDVYNTQGYNNLVSYADLLATQYGWNDDVAAAFVTKVASAGTDGLPIDKVDWTPNFDAKTFLGLTETHNGIFNTATVTDNVTGQSYTLEDLYNKLTDPEGDYKWTEDKAKEFLIRYNNQSAYDKYLEMQKEQKK